MRNISVILQEFVLEVVILKWSCFVLRGKSIFVVRGREGAVRIEKQAIVKAVGVRAYDSTALVVLTDGGTNIGAPVILILFREGRVFSGGMLFGSSLLTKNIRRFFLTQKAGTDVTLSILQYCMYGKRVKKITRNKNKKVHLHTCK